MRQAMRGLSLAALALTCAPLLAAMALLGEWHTRFVSRIPPFVTRR
jgi:hypothetical protein